MTLMNPLPEPLAFASEARAAFGLLILSLVGFEMLWYFDRLPEQFAKFAITFSAIWLFNQRSLRKKYIDNAAKDTKDDENLLLNLARSLGIPLTRVVFTRNSRDSRALTFIDRNSTILVLGGQFRILRHRATAIYNGVVFHEFGHIINRDIRITQIARTIVATTITLPVLNLLPNANECYLLYADGWERYHAAGYSFTFMLSLNWRPFVSLILKPFFIPMIMIIIYKLFLRNREFAADRISNNLGGREGLVQIFSEGHKKNNFLFALFSSHPEPIQRAATVINLETFSTPSSSILGVLGYLSGFVYALSIAIDTVYAKNGLYTMPFNMAHVVYSGLVIFAYMASANHLERALAISIALKLSMKNFAVQTFFSLLSFLIGFCLANTWLGPHMFIFIDHEGVKAHMLLMGGFIVGSALAILLLLASVMTTKLMRYTEGQVRPRGTLAIVRFCSTSVVFLFAMYILGMSMRLNLLPIKFVESYNATVEEFSKDAPLVAELFSDVSDKNNLFANISFAVVYLAIAFLWVFILYRRRRIFRRRQKETNEELSWPEWMFRPVAVRG